MELGLIFDTAETACEGLLLTFWFRIYGRCTVRAFGIEGGVLGLRPDLELRLGFFLFEFLLWDLYLRWWLGYGQ